MAPPSSTMALSLSSKRRMYAVPGEMWADVGRYRGGMGEIWGDVGRAGCTRCLPSAKGDRVRARVRVSQG